MIARIRQRAGDWWYEVRIDLWSQAQRPDGSPAVEPSPVVFRVPARLVTPIDGSDYSCVPTRRSDAPVAQPEEVIRQWSAQELPTAVGRPRLRVIHHQTCWLAETEPSLTLDDVRRALAEGAEPCTACGVQEQIRG
ncbi:DUF6233 domain-containing protein [Streptomyces sp. NPDC021100]|uniref:DUF6233 domain-containing protein n=1 Tax=Streptomyces sp. NPDC021100 TaxID=3365114 RepID=UPI0037937E36